MSDTQKQVHNYADSLKDLFTNITGNGPQGKKYVDQLLSDLQTRLEAVDNISKADLAKLQDDVHNIHETRAIKNVLGVDEAVLQKDVARWKSGLNASISLPAWITHVKRVKSIAETMLEKERPKVSQMVAIIQLPEAEIRGLETDQLNHMRTLFIKNANEAFIKKRSSLSGGEIQKLWSAAVVEVNNEWSQFIEGKVKPWASRGGIRQIDRPNVPIKNPVAYLSYMKDQALQGNYLPLLKRLNDDEVGGRLKLPDARPPQFTQDELQQVYLGRTRGIKYFTTRLLKWLGYGALATLVVGLLVYYMREYYKSRKASKDPSEWYREISTSQGSSSPGYYNALVVRLVAPSTEALDEAADAIYSKIGATPSRRHVKETKKGNKHVARLVLYLPASYLKDHDNVIKHFKKALSDEKIPSSEGSLVGTPTSGSSTLTFTVKRSKRPLLLAKQRKVSKKRRKKPQKIETES
jgi:hypothetical protein